MSGERSIPGEWTAMVMRPDPRVGALTQVRRSRAGPWWLWAIVLILAGTAGYASFLTNNARQQLASAESEQHTLAGDNDRLEANLRDARQKLEDASRTERALDAALKQSRTDTQAANEQVREAQAQVKALQDKLDAARKAAATSKTEVERLSADAASAHVAFQQVKKLQERVAALSKDNDAARADAERLKKDLAAAVEAKTELEREIASLKGQVEEMRRQLDITTSATSQGN